MNYFWLQYSSSKYYMEGELNMSNEYEADLITLLDEEGEEHEFEVIDEIDLDDGHYLALVPTENNKAADPDTYFIFEVAEEDGEEQLMEVEDEELVEKLAEIFEKRFEEAFYEEDGEESAE